MNGQDHADLDARYAFGISDQSKSHFLPRWISLGEGPERHVPITKADQDMLDAIRGLPNAKRDALAVVLKS